MRQPRVGVEQDVETAASFVQNGILARGKGIVRLDWGQLVLVLVLVLHISQLSFRMHIRHMAFGIGFGFGCLDLTSRGVD